MSDHIRPTFYLFSEPSFIGGMAYNLDLGNTLNVYNESETAEIADYKAIRNDWLAVGKDLGSSIKKHGQRIKEREKVTN